MEILNFSSYLKIFEQEAGAPTGSTSTSAADDKVSGQTKNVINLIGILYFFLLSRLMSISKNYKDVVVDINAINSSGIDKKADELKRVFNKVSEAMMEEFKKEGLQPLYKSAGDKTADAFGTLVNQYKDDKETLEAINSYFSKRMTGHLNYLIDSKKEVKESSFYESEEELFESLFSTKKGNVKNMLKQAVALDATLDSAVNDASLKTIAEKFKGEVKQLKDRLADLSVAKKKDIKEEELDKIQSRLEIIPQEFNKEQEKTLKNNTSNKEASAVYVEAATLANEAIEKEAEIRGKLSKEAELKKAEDDKKKSEEFEKIRVKISGDIDPQKTQVSKSNRDVQKFQGLVLDVFERVPEVAETQLFKKFDKFGADGKFGGTTQGMAVALKAGFGLKDTSRNITQELLDEITKYAEEKKIKVMEPKKVEKIGDSLIHDFSSYNRMVEFNSFIYEGFDVEKFKVAAGGGNPSASEAPTKKELAKVEPESGAADPNDVLSKVPSELRNATEKNSGSETTKKLKEKLLSIGFKEAKAGDGAIAYSEGLRVFPGGKYWEVATKKIGSFDPEEVIQKGLDAYFTDPNGKKKLLKYEINNPLGSLHTIYDQLWHDLNGDKRGTGGARNKELYSKLLPALSQRELEKIAHYYKGVTKRGLLNDLDDEWSNTKEIREFTREFYQILKKYK